MVSMDSDNNDSDNNNIHNNHDDQHYNDYNNASLSENYDSNIGLFKHDSNDNEDPVKINAQLVAAVKKANDFLEDIVQIFCKRRMAPMADALNLGNSDPLHLLN